jgi:hypothetical protein
MQEITCKKGEGEIPPLQKKSYIISEIESLLFSILS